MGAINLELKPFDRHLVRRDRRGAIQASGAKWPNRSQHP